MNPLYDPEFNRPDDPDDSTELSSEHELRKSAEEKFRSLAKEIETLGPVETKRLIYDLHMCQIKF